VLGTVRLDHRDPARISQRALPEAKRSYDPPPWWWSRRLKATLRVTRPESHRCRQ